MGFFALPVAVTMAITLPETKIKGRTGWTESVAENSSIESEHEGPGGCLELLEVMSKGGGRQKSEWAGVGEQPV